MPSPLRKLGFAAMTTLGVLVLVELAAWGWEAINPPLPPTPMPAPMTSVNSPVRSRQAMTAGIVVQ